MWRQKRKERSFIANSYSYIKGTGSLKQVEKRNFSFFVLRQSMDGRAKEKKGVNYEEV